jgi:hypothetical protein
MAENILEQSLRNIETNLDDVEKSLEKLERKQENSTKPENCSKLFFVVSQLLPFL